MRKTEAHSFGSKLKELRLQAKLTQEELAYSLNEKYDLNESKATISQFENNKRVPDLERIVNIADFFGVTLDTLACRTIPNGQNESISNSNILDMQFNSPQEALSFILKQEMIADYGGYDLDTMSDDEIMEMAVIIKWKKCAMELKTKLKNIVNNYNTTNVKEICDYLDIEIAYTEFKAKTLESRLMIVDGNGYIFVRPNLDERYENFLIAHELGHYILHYDKNINFNFLNRIYKTRLEKEANEFAIRFLTYDVNMDNYENLEFLAKEKGIPLKIWYTFF